VVNNSNNINKVVNNSNNITLYSNKMNSHLRPQIIEHKKDHHIYWWKSRSWLQTGTKMSHSGRVKSTCCGLISDLNLVRDSSVVRRHYIFLLEPSDVRELYIRKTADLLLQLWVSTFPRFVAIGFYFLSEILI
jgi:hypothetical protein